MTEKLTCSKCNEEIVQPQPGAITLGYGLGRDGAIVCYACCADTDRQSMRDTGAITLYLIQPSPITIKSGRASTTGWEITNWPGSLVFAPYPSAQISQTNWGLQRIDVWFNFDGFVWHGKNIGDSQLLHCRRTKQLTNPQPIPKVHYVGCAGLRGYLPSYQTGPYLYRGEIAQDLGDLHELSDRKIKQLRRDWYVDLNLYTHGNEYAEFTVCDCGRDYEECSNSDDPYI